MAKPAESFDDLTKSKAFLKWFWQGQNGNNLINFLNKHKHPMHKDKLRREKWSPFAYGLVLNGDIYNGPSPGNTNFNKKFKLVKIGFTQCSTASDENNRMEQIIKKIKKKFKEVNDVAVIFVLMKNAIDTSSHHEFEERLRLNFGIPVEKNYAKSLELPVPTEWVLTTQEYIEKLKKYIKEQLEEKKSIDASILKPGSFKKFELSSQDEKTFKSIIAEICNRSTRTLPRSRCS